MAKKYVAFTADTEAYFCPPSFEGWQGVYTQDMVDICEAEGVPFTWLIIIDRENERGEYREIDAMAKVVYPRRKGIDEFSIHTHFEWFVLDEEGENAEVRKAYRDVERRLKFLEGAKKRRDKVGLPNPVTVRYGGSISRNEYYLIEDFKYLYDELGVRNWCFGKDPSTIRGITECEEIGNGVWRIDGGREITIIRSRGGWMQDARADMLADIDSNMEKLDYLIVGCHDYVKAVPDNLQAAIEHIRGKYDVEFVTIGRIGELIRAGEVDNSIK